MTRIRTVQPQLPSFTLKWMMSPSEGLTVDGDNPALEGGVDAIEGIASYEGVGQIVIENNILQNFTYTGVGVLQLYR